MTTPPNINQVLIHRLDPTLPLPEYATTGSAAMDVMAAETTVIPARQWCVVPCGFRLALPVGYEAQIRPRSGLAARYGVTVLNAPGTIDADYRGEVKVVLINHGTADFSVTHGMRIAQMLVVPVAHWYWQETDTLEDTERGAGGFGSSGLSC